MKECSFKKEELEMKKNQKFVLMKRYYNQLDDSLTYSYVRKEIIKPGKYSIKLVERLSEATIFGKDSPITHYEGMVSFPIEL
jgi:hypothetical protein